MADDDYERLLREVEAELGSGPAGGRSASAKPLKAGDGAGAAGGQPPAPEREGVVDRVRGGVPRGVVVGAVWGLVVGGVFSVLPVVDGLSGAIAGFVTGFGVSIAGRLRRR